ncbi:hypothetical protein G6016_04875 [Dietzia aerolata]|uniref:Uncharacterized protein n=1 Tax=Dietzia aerolata TaxID=595984 RepID=A0ABV5JRS5_9ACTN|nr:hypothetical protein [Dietzia aerolata]MBB0968304.1 hypothetical protein [Dietzia aerolata]
MSGSEPQRPEDGTPPDSGASRSGPPTGVIAAAVVTVAVLVIGLAVVVGLRLSGTNLGDTISWGPLQTSTRTPVTRPDRTPRSTSDTTRSTTSTRATTTARRASASCSELRTLTSPGELAAGSRIVDCADGWAVLASAHSGDPYWVAYRNGRWQPVNDISMYLLTCPDEAIAQGAPAWMAERHLGNCPDRNPGNSSIRPGTERPSPRPPTPPTRTNVPQPSPPQTPPETPAPSTPPSSAPPTTSVPEETSENTTTTAAATPPSAAAEELE